MMYSRFLHQLKTSQITLAVNNSLGNLLKARQCLSGFFIACLFVHLWFNVS